jgi:hypothetical protein
VRSLKTVLYRFQISDPAGGYHTPTWKSFTAGFYQSLSSFFLLTLTEKEIRKETCPSQFVGGSRRMISGHDELLQSTNLKKYE